MKKCYLIENTERREVWPQGPVIPTYQMSVHRMSSYSMGSCLKKKTTKYGGAIMSDIASEKLLLSQTSILIYSHKTDILVNNI